MFSLDDKVVCVIGGTGLIGKPVVEALDQAGATVYVGSRHPNGMGHLSIDISDENSIRDFISTVTAEMGRIDVWVNCAFPRVVYSTVGLRTIDTGKMLEDLRCHLLGYFNASRYSFMQMQRQGYGSIINFGSVYGEVVPDFRIYQNTEIEKNPTYFIIKAGIHMLTNYFAVMGAPYNIRVNTIAPGGVEDNHSDSFVKQYSAHVPMARMATPADIPGSVLFLASDASSYMTGQTLFVDGGLTIW